MKGDISDACEGALFLMRHGWDLWWDGIDCWWIGCYGRHIHPLTAQTLIRRGLVVPAGRDAWRLP